MERLELRIRLAVDRRRVEADVAPPRRTAGRARRGGRPGQVDRVDQTSTALFCDCGVLLCGRCLLGLLVRLEAGLVSVLAGSLRLGAVDLAAEQPADCREDDGLNR